jgi:hypothetical protein
MSNQNNEPQSQQEAWNRANNDRQQGNPPANTQNWNDAARQNYNNQFHGGNNGNNSDKK